MIDSISRGVKRAPYKVRGRAVLVCIDSFGNMVRQVKVNAGAEPRSVAEFLQRWLDHHHPVPRLALVGTSCGAHSREQPRAIGARLCADPYGVAAKRARDARLIENVRRKLATMPRVDSRRY